MTLKTLFKFIFLSCFVTLVACDRGGDGIPEGDPDFVDTSDPNNFIKYLNPQNSLPAGSSYKLIIGTQTSNQTGDFSATITLSDGTAINCSGSWAGVSGPDVADNDLDAPCTTFEATSSGGVTVEVTSNTDTCIYILDRNNQTISDTAASGCRYKDNMDLPSSRINFESHGTAYYNVVDPDNTRTTLDDWKTANRFGQACPAETIAKYGECEMQVQFRDTKDLGYGRNMFIRREDNASGLTHLAIFVENFQVDAIAGLQYSALNYESLIEDQRQWHFGSNAIEFSSYPYGPGDPSDRSPADPGTDALFTKFYTFRADRSDFSAPEVRLDSVDLDARGFISMPGPCIVCHGGRARPLYTDGNSESLALPFPDGILGDTQAQLNMIEVDTLGFPERTDQKSDQQEAGLRFLNQAIFDSYQVVATQTSEWDPVTAMDLLAGSYGGVDANNLFENDKYNRNYLPAGWEHDPSDNNPPLGAEALYNEVIKPHCITCHSKLGNKNDSTISFNNYNDFISYSEQIERYIYDKGLMPLSLLNFDEFWDTISPDKAQLLATHIDGFSHRDSNGMIIEPGAPVAQPAVSGAVYINSESEAGTAVAGTNFTSFSMSAEGSPFSTNYQWDIISPTDTGASIENSTSIRARFVNGTNNTDYILRLTTSNNEGESDSQLFKVSVNISVGDPRNLRFTNEITTTIQTTLGCDAGGCHSPGTNFVPMYLTANPADQPTGTTIYQQAIQRVNFSDPLESKLLRRPSGYQHPGGCLTGFDIFPDTTTDGCDGSNDRSNYDLFLNWILEGSLK